MEDEKPAKAATPEPVPAIEETPVTAPAAEAETPPATGTTPTTVEEPGQRAGADAVGVEGYEQMKAKALADAAAAKNATPKTEEAPPAEAAAEITPAPGEEAAPAATTEEEPAATTEPDKEPPNRIRIGRLKPTDRALLIAATELADAEGIDVATALERVSPPKADSGQTPNAQRRTPNGGNDADAEPAKSEGGRTRAEIEAAIAEQKKVKKQAATDLDTGKMYEADEEIETLREELGQVTTAETRAEQERQSAEKTKFATSVKDAQDRATKNWPEIADDKSHLSKRMVELADAYEKNPDLAHHVFEADAPFFFADLAAKELGLLPKDLRKPAAPVAATTTPPKPATPTATKPALRNQSAVVRPTQPAVAPASGAARTGEGPSGDALGVDKIRSPHDYDDLKKRLKIPSLAQAR